MLPEVACVAIFRNGKILMGRRRDNGKWTQTGGHLEKGESPVEGAVREVKEEAGIDIEPHTLKHLATEVVTKPDGKKIKVHAFCAVIHKAPTSIKEDPDAEVHRWHWLSLETLHSPKVWGELHVKPEDNVVMKGLGFVKTAAFLTFDEIKMRSPKHNDSWYPNEQLAKGMIVEKEHSDDPKIRSTITKNHLDERRDYYNNDLFKEDLEKKAMATSKTLQAIRSQMVKDVPKQVFTKAKQVLTKKGSDMSVFWDGFEKQAKLDLSGLERHMSPYGYSVRFEDKKDADLAQKHIDDATSKSFAIRHPWLTGIPTLGMWPAIAHDNAMEDISRKIMRESPTMREMVNSANSASNAKRRREEEEDHRREVELMPKHIEERKRESYERMLGTAALGAMAVAGRHYDSKDMNHGEEQE